MDKEITFIKFETQAAANRFADLILEGLIAQGVIDRRSLIADFYHKGWQFEINRPALDRLFGHGKTDNPPGPPRTGPDHLRKTLPTIILKN